MSPSYLWPNTAIAAECLVSTPDPDLRQRGEEWQGESTGLGLNDTFLPVFPPSSDITTIFQKQEGPLLVIILFKRGVQKKKRGMRAKQL